MTPFRTLYCAIFFVLLLSTAAAQNASETSRTTYRLELLLDGVPIHWDSGENTVRNGEFFSVWDKAEPLTVYFEGGEIQFDLADWGVFSHPHVTGVRFSREPDPQRYTLGATVVHSSADPKDYTDTISFEGSENGRISLRERLDSPQGFTRSQEHVRATGTLSVKAEDSVRSGSGTTITLHLDAPPFNRIYKGNLRYVLTPQ